MLTMLKFEGKALVTGGAGFIGSHVAREVIKLGMDVVVLDDLSGGFEENIPQGAKFVRGSISDHALVDGLFEKHRFRIIYHLAAYAAENLSHFIKRFNYNNNVIGSVNLINAAVNHAAECFVFTSSIAAYGPCPSPMREDMHASPEDSYGIAKLTVEQELRASHRIFGLPYVIFRPHNVFGPAQNIGDRYRNVIGIFMNCVMQGRPMPIFGSGEQTRAFSYIDDVAPYIAISPSVPGAECEVFNIGSDEPTSVAELARRVAMAMEVSHREEHHTARHEILHAFSSHDKFRRVFGPRPCVPLDEGLKRMASWAKAAGPRQSKAFENIEILKNLPDSWRS
jgi:UDP-glucose 4-epimerase